MKKQSQLHSLWATEVIFWLCTLLCFECHRLEISIEMLYISKLPTVAMAGFLCAQTAIAKVTDEGPDRLTALGRLTTAYTIGGVIGP